VRGTMPQRGKMSQRGTMPYRVAIGLIACLALLAAGCDGGSSADAGRRSWPPAIAGRACQLLHYDVVEEHLGTRFDTAGGANRDATYTCALTQAGHDYPDLTLAVTATTADEVIFTATVAPSGSTVVKDLGRIAYRVAIAPSRSSGPGVEVGWLSAYERLLIVRYTFPPEATAQQVAELTSKLIALAHQIDQSLPAA